MCVMNLTNLKVPSEKVGNVIREVSKLCGKFPNSVPSVTAVSKIVDYTLIISHKQLNKVLEGKEHTTLYTDETRKYGKCIQTNVLTDETYILRLRELFNKSGQSTLDTFKYILNDINDYCFQAEKKSDMHVGYQILANIRDTMSDRASTDKTFNGLLEQFRIDILPDDIDNWNEINEKQKTLC